jgi:hypothetical protein
MSSPLTLPDRFRGPPQTMKATGPPAVGGAGDPAAGPGDVAAAASASPASSVRVLRRVCRSASYAPPDVPKWSRW